MISFQMHNDKKALKKKLHEESKEELKTILINTAPWKRCQNPSGAESVASPVLPAHFGRAITRDWQCLQCSDYPIYWFVDGLHVNPGCIFHLLLPMEHLWHVFCRAALIPFFRILFHTISICCKRRPSVCKILSGQKEKQIFGSVSHGLNLSCARALRWTNTSHHVAWFAQVFKFLLFWWCVFVFAVVLSDKGWTRYSRQCSFSFGY